MKILSHDFYQQENVLEISRQLIGKFLFTNFDQSLCGGMIVETEAYRAPEDRASHAYGLRRTKRNQVMYEAGGLCYVYMCYGIHCLLNIVTHQKEMPHAVLIRAIEPILGIDKMIERRKQKILKRNLTAGPGALTQALGVNLSHNGLSLLGPEIWIEDRDLNILPDDIIASPRVGIDYAGEDAALPWRFRLKNSLWTSLAK